MNGIMELLSSFGVDPIIAALGGGVIGVLALYLILRKGKKTKKKKTGGVQTEYGDVTTSGYDTRAGNFIDELNSDSVLTQDVQDFAVPNFNKEDLERTTGTKGYKKKVFNAALPGMTFGDNRTMIPLVEEDLETSPAVELRAEMNAVTRTSIGSFGLKPKTVSQGMDISTITSSGLKILDDVEQLMRPAAPEKVASDSPVQKINAPMSLGANVETKPTFDLNFDIDEPTRIKNLEKVTPKEDVSLSFDLPVESNAIKDLKPEGDVLDFKIDVPDVNSNIVSVNVPIYVELEEPKDALELFTKNNSVPDVLNEKSSHELGEGLEFTPTDHLSNDKVPFEAEIDISDIPGLNIEEVESFIDEQPKVQDFIFTPYVVSKLDESIYPETAIYHQEIETALFLDEEGMKDKALQTLENTVELIKNIKVKFYFKLAIQSYTNKTGDKTLGEIIKNFYDFEYEKYSK